MKKILSIVITFMFCIYCYPQKNKSTKNNSTKVSVYDRVNNKYYSHHYIMNYNCTKMKPIKIMQGFILSDSTENKVVKNKILIK